MFSHTFISSARRWLFLATLLLCNESISVRAEAATRWHARARFDESEKASYELRGPVRVYIERVIANWLLKAPGQNPAMLGMFANRDKEPLRDLLPWSGEFAGKYLTASTEMLRLTKNRDLAKHLGEFVHQFAALQDANGYLGPFPANDQLTGHAANVRNSGTWDAWGHYHALIGLLMWHEMTGDPEALMAARKIGDLLCARFLATGKHVSDIGSPDQNQAVNHGLARLYEISGEEKYRDLAKQVINDFEAPGAGDYLRTALAGKEFYDTPKPRWESLHSILGLAELYRITGTEEYRRAFEHIWWSIVKLDRHNNGGFSSGEQAVGNPYNPAPIETCCTIAWIALSVEMLRTSGNSVVADELELSTLNSVVGLHSPDGKWSTYNTPMDGRRVPSTKDISFQIRPGSEQLNCCSVNAARGFGMISDWALLKENAVGKESGALVLNWFGPSVVTTQFAGTQISLTQETEYPRDGHVVVRVDPAKTVKFTLKLRIPHWSARTKLIIDGREELPKAGTYFTLNREWRSGDRVDLHLDMRLRAWVGERDCTGKVALFRGPLLLTREFPGKLDGAAPPTAGDHRDVDFPAPLDLRAVKSKVIVPPADGGIFLAIVEVADATGHTVRLRDFGTAGQNGISYISWLPARNVSPAEFSRTNPLRTCALEF